MENTDKQDDVIREDVGSDKIAEDRKNGPGVSDVAADEVETTRPEDFAEPSVDQPKSSGQRLRGRSVKGNRTMLVRYGKMGFVGQFRFSEREIPPGVGHVVIKTERGMEIGEIISPFCYDHGSCTISSEQIDKYYDANGPNYPISRNGTVVRFAGPQDLKDQQHLNANVRDELRFCKRLIEKLNISMKLVDAEHLFGGERVIFYFMAEGRVDFRDLVKELAGQYQTRIEMRQVGARDEARLVADFEACGRECCCKNFLKVLQPVNMRMAKLQKATLDPSKISGRCGRLKCCLRYEDKVYEELYKRLPRKNTCVLTEKGHGVVTATQVLTQLVKVRLEKTERVIAVNVEEILERNYIPPKPAENSAGPADVGERPPLSYTVDDRQGFGSVASEVSEKIEAEVSRSLSEQPWEAQPEATDGPEATGGPDNEDEVGGSKKRRHRRRKKKKPLLTESLEEGTRHEAREEGTGH
jgi:cell fate regulator YaaT (PSP1 superfamily)